MNVFRRLKDYICWIYTQYTLVTAVYMLEPAERWTFNSIIVLTIATAAYTTYIYLPSHCTMILGYLGLLEMDSQTT
ncbi:serine palmitoyltransferase small subunit A-like [Strongylocentrotus purpuratus]|uniref:Serine palmitoyltransferase small subunit A n=1 Tax=Strongylocentrotus purpuratus TaxID=7668 RepID=A0A7M7PRI9_STRPU|nr:serine palmitoyltransferase small subunit A-like [Strongylocentrotus purpuratus]